jgi:hypothetical protein
MKKLTLCLVLVVFSISFLMGEEDYSDIKNLLAKQGLIFQGFIDGCDNAKNAQDVVKVVTIFKDGYKDITPSLIAVSQKYKDLAVLMETNPPEALKPDLAKIAELGPKMDVAFGKISQYMTDPEVLKAFREFTQLMQDLQNTLSPEQTPTEEQKATGDQKVTEGQK